MCASVITEANIETQSMPKISLIKPLDQPPGKRRLLDDLRNALHDKRFSDFRVIVAYAKSGPLIRLKEDLEGWRKAGNKSQVIFGIDQLGTSKEALQLSLDLFDTVYVTQEAGITFHPKIYIFTGDSDAHAFIGSNNLTVGGTEKNFEVAVHLEIALPSEKASLDELNEAWNDLLPAACPATIKLDTSEFKRLVKDGLVVEEKVLRRNSGDADAATVGSGRKAARSGMLVKPESPLPKKFLAAKKSAAAAKPKTTKSAGGLAGTAPTTATAARGFAIQIKPHHNGEIFLSVTAALQNPDFFKWPFNGLTTPKKVGNPSYPQLDPDPVVNITVIGAAAKSILTLSEYGLNTVYYEKKSEIRVTASPLVGIVPDYSVMIMEHSEEEGVDYDITIHTPDSPEYAGWVDACDQSMPGGGQTPRKYGWF